MQVLAVLALVATASAFSPAPVRVARRSAVAMSAQKPSFVKSGLATLAASPLVASSAAFATEGTGEGLGVDDGRLLAVLFAVHWSIAALWYSWQKDQPDRESDFFAEYDDRRA